MKHITLAAALVMVLSVLAGCRKSDDAPYIIFRNAGGQTLSAGSDIPVAAGSTHTVYAEAGYERSGGNNLDYDWKIDDGEFGQYSAFDGLKILTMGNHNNLSIRKVSFTITFSDDVAGGGSTVTIRVRDQQTLSARLTFVVE